jgi:precorrin-2 dehydrogenase
MNSRTGGEIRDFARTGSLGGSIMAVTNWPPSLQRRDAVLFPIFLKLAARRCLVVGAGKIAESKIESLLLTDAKIQVVAPRGTQTIERWARETKISWDVRPFEATDVEQVSLVIAATDSEEVNHLVFGEARARGIFCNAVDDPEHCDFYCPAIVRRGPLQIAISTGGNSPALAQRLRRELEEQFGAEYEDWVRWLGEARASLFARTLSPPQRRKWLHSMAGELSFQKFRQRSGRALGGERSR